MANKWMLVGKCQVCSADLFQNGSGPVQDTWSGYDCIAYYPPGLGMEPWKPNHHRLVPKAPNVHIEPETQLCVGFYDPILDTWQLTSRMETLSEALEMRDAYRRMAIVHDTVHVLEKKITFTIIDP